MPMPRTAQEIIDQAENLAAQFENQDPDPAAIKDGTPLRAVRKAFQARADAERDLAEAVAVARGEGHSWAAIGAMVGTSGEAARQRYGQDRPAVAAVRSGVSSRGTATKTLELRQASPEAVALGASGYRRHNRFKFVGGGSMANERTGKKAASNAGKALAAKSKAAAKSAAGSALSQTKSSGVTGKKAASNAGSTLGAKTSSKSAKSAAGSALTQKPSKGGTTAKKKK
jgi:hypothetical protein